MKPIIAKQVQEPAPPLFVGARFIARKYSVSERHILKMAANGTIPSIRIGRKSVRFDEAAVAASLEGRVAI